MQTITLGSVLSMKYKKGQLWKSKDTGVVLELINKKSGNKHWNTKKVGGKNAHKIHEGTLIKFYELIN